MIGVHFLWREESKLLFNGFFKSDLEKSEDPDKLLKEIEERMENVRSPFRTAESFLAEEIIDPTKTRELICEFTNLAAPLRKTGKVGFGLRP